MHNDGKLLLGVSLSSDKAVTEFGADPATFEAGLAVRLKNDGTLSLNSADGGWVGVSLGKSLSDTSRTAVLRAGLGVPVKVALKRSSGAATITDFANLVSGTADTLLVGATTFTAQAGAATPGEATFQAATSNEATAASLAAQINAHAAASDVVRAIAAGAVVTIFAAVEGEGEGHDVAVAYTDNDTNVGMTLAGLADGKLSGGSNDPSDADAASKGFLAYFNNTTGKADQAPFGSITSAVYLTGALVGITAADTEVPAAYVDMPGGL